MASTEKLNGLIKGLADVVQTQQKTDADAFNPIAYGGGGGGGFLSHTTIVLAATLKPLKL